MNIIPKDKDKRIQLIFAIFCTLVALGLMWMFLINPQKQALRDIAQKHVGEEGKLKDVDKTIKTGGDVDTQLTDATYNLARAEEDMASGDVYAWTYDTIRRFKANYRVEIPTVSQPTMGEVDLMPQFPYKQVKVSVSGTAYYHDLGKFIADFENTFPHIRVANLTIEPAGSSVKSEDEKLNFRMDIIALVKPNS